MSAETMGDAVRLDRGVTCVLNCCNRPQGDGTWVNVRAAGQLPVCEEHWRALLAVPYLPAPPVTSEPSLGSS